MSSYSRRYYNNTSAMPFTVRKHDRWTDQDYEAEIKQLKEVVKKEKDKLWNAQREVEELSKQLRQTRAELDEETSLKEHFMKKEREAQQELEHVRKCITPKSTSRTSKIAKHRIDTQRTYKKKDLVEQYNVHMAAYITKLKELKEGVKDEVKDKGLPEEMASSHAELSNQHESEVLQCQWRISNKVYSEKRADDTMMEEITKTQQYFQQEVKKLNLNTISASMSNSSDTEEEEQSDSDLPDAPKRKRRSLRKWKKRQRCYDSACPAEQLPKHFWGKHDRWTDQDYEAEIKQLKEVVKKEKDKLWNAQREVEELSKQLRQTRAELDEETSLKEHFMKKEKEAQQELEHVRKCITPKSTSRTSKIAKHRIDTQRTYKKKDLVEQYNVHMAAYITKLKELKEGVKDEVKDKGLPEEMASSHAELSNQHESEVLQCQWRNSNKVCSEKRADDTMMEEINKTQQYFQQEVKKLNLNTISASMSNSSDTEEEEQSDSDLPDAPKRKRRSLRKWKKRQRCYD
ncbi:myosin heavy chain, striated muscle-like [Gouania willdenowi]|uniref:myosin heavy chain, striated muscle-like n=1 Tax=Gouania willdenowi TaxID=441366 RepID=UPI0010561D08|nr:myosin heavy chain, striated muscle-like [Gouania willdenowi]